MVEENLLLPCCDEQGIEPCCDSPAPAPPPPAAPAALESNDAALKTEAPPFKDAERELEHLQSKLPKGEWLLALRCPCGHTMGVGVPSDIYAKWGARKLASQAIGVLLPMLADHLELLAQRLARSDAERAERAGVPSADEIVAAYHNHPCSLRDATPPTPVVVAPPAEVVATTTPPPPEEGVAP